MATHPIQVAGGPGGQQDQVHGVVLHDQGEEYQQPKQIFYDVRPDKQTVMTSATWPVCEKCMKNPFTMFIRSLDLTAAVYSVSQKIVKCGNDHKWDELQNFLGARRKK